MTEPFQVHTQRRSPDSRAMRCTPDCRPKLWLYLWWFHSAYAGEVARPESKRHLGLSIPVSSKYDHCRARDQQCNRSPLEKQRSATVFLTVDDDQDNTADRAEAAASDYQQEVPVNVEHENTSAFEFSCWPKKYGAM
ncbi:MAG: hypothetical protein KA368_10435 [Acidobacteria bacterium]|nr:hypothetical protein [Acidobacteriota bacterium]